MTPVLGVQVSIQFIKEKVFLSLQIIIKPSWNFHWVMMTQIPFLRALVAKGPLPGYTVWPLTTRKPQFPMYTVGTGSQKEQEVLVIRKSKKAISLGEFQGLPAL